MATEDRAKKVFVSTAQSPRCTVQFVREKPKPKLDLVG